VFGETVKGRRERETTTKESKKLGRESERANGPEREVKGGEGSKKKVVRDRETERRPFSVGWKRRGEEEAKAWVSSSEDGREDEIRVKGKEVLTHDNPGLGDAARDLER